MDDQTAANLGAKLATLDLADDERTMLALLLGGTPEDDDVSGFGAVIEERPTNDFSKVEIVFRSVVGRSIAPTTTNWSWGASQS